MTVIQISPKENEMLLPCLESWRKMVDAGLQHEKNIDLIERLSDCRKMCEETAAFLTQGFRSPESSIHISKDAEDRIQAIMATWKSDNSIAILKIVTCPWNISSCSEENSFPMKGCGISLVHRAIDIAKENGLSVEVTSLKSSKIFFERIGFKEDPTKNLTGDDIFPMIFSSDRIQQNIHLPSALKKEFPLLEEAGLHTEENRKALRQNTRYARDFEMAFQYLRSSGILTQENFNALIQNVPHIQGLAIAFNRLHTAGILTQDNFEILIQNVEYTQKMNCAFDYLQGAGILTQDNFEILIQKVEYAQEMNYAFDYLQGAGILTQDNFEVLIQNVEYAQEINCVFEILERVKMLIQDNFKAFIQNAKNAWEFQGIFDYLERDGILTQENFDTLIENSWCIEKLEERICELHELGILTQDNFNNLIQSVQIVLPPEQLDYPIQKLRRAILTGRGLPEPLLAELRNAIKKGGDIDPRLLTEAIETLSEIESNEDSLWLPGS